MKKIKRLLVGLDLSPMDEILIKKTIELVQLFDADMVYFVHVAKDLVLPEQVGKDYPGLLIPIHETIEKEISDAVMAAGFPETLNYEVEAKEGSPMDKIIRWSEAKDVDMIIMGRKSSLEGSGALPRRIALKAPCSILFLTENMTEGSFKKILVPVDFSSYSLLTLDYANKFNPDKDAILCYHVYEVPHGYSKTGKTYEEFSEIMRNNSKKEYEKFLQKNKLPPLACEFQVRGRGNRADYVLDAAIKSDVELIIIGSRGRTDSAAFLLGSVAEKVININNQIPMLVIKKKGENMRFMEALFRI